MDLVELVARCEAASGPDRELDAHIWCALNGVKYLGHYDVYGRDSGRLTQVEFTEPPKRRRSVTGDRGPFKHALHVTELIDAAMTLVPEGWDGGLYLATDTHRPEVQLETPAMRRSLSMDDERAEGSAATLALALCATALRARSTL